MGFEDVTLADNPARFEDQYHERCAVFLNLVVSKVSAKDRDEEPLLTALLSVKTTPLYHDIKATISSGL